MQTEDEATMEEHSRKGGTGHRTTQEAETAATHAARKDTGPEPAPEDEDEESVLTNKIGTEEAQIVLLFCIFVFLFRVILFLSEPFNAKYVAHRRNLFCCDCANNKKY